MTDQELIEKARHLLDNCKLSGAAIDLCTKLVNEGFHNRSNPDTAWIYDQQRDDLRKLMLMHGIN